MHHDKTVKLQIAITGVRMLLQYAIRTPYQGLKRGLVVLVVNDFWLVVNGNWASCKILKIVQKSIKSNAVETPLFRGLGSSLVMPWPISRRPKNKVAS